jgi:heme/copper-type cytochrome/quinol oxidase subunit 1
VPDAGDRREIAGMHSLVRRYLKTAIAFLAVGLLVGTWMMAERELLGRFPNPYETSAHVHAILVGFVMMMILGVALWLFPRPAKEDTRYTPRAAGAAYWLVTLGTAVRIAGELARPATDAAWLRVAVFSAGVSQVLGLALFFYTMWSRIRPLGSKAREEKGERF